MLGCNHLTIRMLIMLTLKIGVWDVYSQEALLKLIERSEIVVDYCENCVNWLYVMIICT